MKTRAAVRLHCLALLSSATIAAAQPSVPILKLLPSDGGPGEEFGVSIAASQQRVVIGARFDDPNGYHSGSVYVFDLRTGSELRKIVPDDGLPEAQFARNIAVVGSLAVIGAPFDDTVNDRAGAAYVFDLISGQQLHKMTIPNGQVMDNFGAGVAVEGSRILVGAPGDDEAGEDSGAIYCFDAASGSQQSKWLPEGAAMQRAYGYTIALDGDTAVTAWVSESFDDFIDILDAETGEFRRRISLEDVGIPSSQMGQFVCADGKLLVGSPWEAPRARQAGAAYLFDIGTGESLIRFSSPFDEKEEQRFGATTAFDGRVAAIGSFYYNRFLPDFCLCVVDLFDARTGRHLVRLDPDGVEEEELFGFPIVIDLPYVLVGAIHDDENGDNAGAVFVFDISPCLADVSGDGLADTADLSLVLDAFGGDDPAADVNGDGGVDTADLGMVLRSFGERCE